MNSKVLVWSYLLILSFATIMNLYIPKNEAIAKDQVVIPGEAIRLRILANSDTGADQAIKRQVRDAVNAQITLWVQELTSLEKARALLKSKLPELEAIAEEVVLRHGSNQSVNVEFGQVQFPTKLYGEFLYPAGEYQAILITLGEGKGANWWCVLFPPLCFLDFSNGLAVSDGFEDQAGSEKESLDSDIAVEKIVTTTEQVDSEISKRQVDSEKGSEDSIGQADTKEDSGVSKGHVDTKKDSEVSKGLVDIEKDSKISEESQPVKEKAAPVYTPEDEEPVKVKFFVIEMWESIFH